MDSSAEALKWAVVSLRMLQESQSTLMGATRSLLGRAKAADKRCISMKYEILHLKVALCLTWIGAAVYAIYSSSQC